MVSRTLPWMGLGISTNASASARPNPYRLLDRRPGIFDYVEYSAPLEIERARREASLFETMWNRRADVPLLFHPVHLNLYGPELEREEDLAALSRHLREIGSPWVSNDVAWWHSAGRAFAGYLYLAPPLTKEAIGDCARHALHVQSAIEVPLLLENPAIVSVRGPLHVLDFMAELHAKTGLDLLVDVGHLFSHQLSRGLDPASGLDGFPFEAVVEIHIAGGVIAERGTRRFYVDDHPQPIREEVLELFERIATRCPRLRAITYEGDGHPEHLAEDMLARLRRSLPERGETVMQDNLHRAAVHEAKTDAWALFDLAYGGQVPDPALDQEAETFELDLRLAVLAERLDRRLPLTRVLVSGTREALVAFSRSEEHKEGFRGLGRDLSESYKRFVRRRLREEPDDSIAAVFAIESWANEIASHASSGIAAARLPRDLREVQHARRSIERHLASFARISGLWDHQALSSIAQAARRAPERDWEVVVRVRGESVEIFDREEAIASGLFSS
jgi:uncharacterized protein